MLVEINKLNIIFDTATGPLHAVRDLSLHLDAGETLGIVGESGCGKSITNLALMGLLPDTANVTAEKLAFEDKDLSTLPEKDWQKLRGGDISMIFQDPMSALNPCFNVGYQIEETLGIHTDLDKDARAKKALELLDQVGIPAAKERLKTFPHELSGGMSQRVMIAMAIACNPKLLIADEPTTALDVTIQEQILTLLSEIQKERNMAMILVTHDLGVVAQNSDRLNVMYAGEVVETGKTQDIINHPQHPYSYGLLDSLPGRHKQEFRSFLPSIKGMVPDLRNRPQGCQFHPRCDHFNQDKCLSSQSLSECGHSKVRCITPLSEGGAQ